MLKEIKRRSCYIPGTCPFIFSFSFTTRLTHRPSVVADCHSNRSLLLYYVVSYQKDDDNNDDDDDDDDVDSSCSSGTVKGARRIFVGSVGSAEQPIWITKDGARDGDAILPGARQSHNEGDGRVNGAPGVVDEWSRSGPPSFSMSAAESPPPPPPPSVVDLNPNLQDSGHFSASPERIDGVCGEKPCCVKNDEEESYEAFGSVEGDADDGMDSPPGGSSSAPSPTGTNSLLLKNPRSPNSTIGRHSWLRTSLRRTPPCQLYRSGSFNSSGRGSNCDPADDMYSDVSLEDDVIIGLNHKVQMIQEQMDALVDTQSVGEERYARAKQENAMLQARILMLEEAAKDAETRAEERLQAEQRRYRDWASRLERERQLQLENYAIKLQAIESEGTNLREEIGRLREQLEKVKAEKSRLETDLEEARRESDSARESERQAISRANEAQYQVEAARQELSVRIGDHQRMEEELMQQVEELKTRNKSLEESRDELQAAAALQAGRELLLLNPCNNNTAEKGPSLAVELLAGMNQEDHHQMGGQFLGEHGEPPCSTSVSEMRQALKEQQEVNAQLRTYIDGILLNIVENYPQLLEVKQTH
ncbi:rab11 family-interacting protein 4 isoform X2 [Ceratina calcarata]|uniref:Rab11 family-interacting protein 4 isoform X2 n=1 Tax=Ceratina calcarata TaxID=156304 RepID=A0AAJ7SDH8_9HYME|nr:rab11 family-interacting protein 4 isoform X2 [Ceratina calcarata]